jgi:hypothetical protein
MVAAQVQKTSAYFSRYQVKYRRRRGAPLARKCGLQFSL